MVYREGYICWTLDLTILRAIFFSLKKPVQRRCTMCVTWTRIFINIFFWNFSVVARKHDIINHLSYCSHCSYRPHPFRAVPTKRMSWQRTGAKCNHASTTCEWMRISRAHIAPIIIAHHAHSWKRWFDIFSHLLSGWCSARRIHISTMRVSFCVCLNVAGNLIRLRPQRHITLCSAPR